nr:MAG TPA: hypothetical protein [Caudoviricetes sp.]
MIFPDNVRRGVSRGQLFFTKNNKLISISESPGRGI